ncbi:MAG: LytR C-terminal domain-containing protein [Arachnia propionica]|uniref:LytR C-terminal domain-containing protein n=1 Tax=Arachnia propionica TaxID=1750 RepID=UPI002708003E|nr:LytR C-terminal domain-containing protein [Arachnia propionica]
MRIFRLIATPFLLLGLLALLVWGAFWGWRNLTAPLPEPEPTPCVTHTTDLLTPNQVTVRVINGGQTVGLANRIGEALIEAGFRVDKISNTEERIDKVVIIRSGSNNADAATLVGSHFNDAVIENDARIDGTVDILVGNNFPGQAASPLTEVPVSSGTICLAPSPSPTDLPSGPAPEATQS